MRVNIRHSSKFVLALLACAGFSMGSHPAFAATCESLATLQLPDTAITSAEQVAAGACVPPPGMPMPSAKSLPAFCRVQATITPAKDSSIEVEVWLPLAGWNGKYRGEGNG